MVLSMLRCSMVGEWTGGAVGFQTSNVPFRYGTVNRRFPGVLPRRLGGCRTQRRRKSLSGGWKVSKAWGGADLTLKLYLIDSASFMPRRAWGVSANRPPGNGCRRAESSASVTPTSASWASKLVVCGTIVAPRIALSASCLVPARRAVREAKKLSRRTPKTSTCAP